MSNIKILADDAADYVETQKEIDRISDDLKIIDAARTSKSMLDITLFISIKDHPQYADSEIYLDEIAGEVLESMTNILTERQMSLQCKRNALIQKAQRG